MQSTIDEIKEFLADANPEAILFDDIEEALVGVGCRGMQGPVAVYCRDAALQVYCRDMTEDEALEHFEFNVIGGYYGDEATPIFTELMRTPGPTKHALTHTN